MFDTLFGGVTAIATSVTAIAMIYDHWKKYTAVPSCLSITGNRYFRKADQDFCQVSFVLKSTKRLRLQSIRATGKVSLKGGDPFEERQTYGLTLDDPKRTYQLDLLIQPYPKDGQPLILWLNFGSWFDHKFVFYPNDFSISGHPDLGRWPVDHAPTRQ